MLEIINYNRDEYDYPALIVLGCFDALHVGHAELLKKAKLQAKINGLDLGVMMFAGGKGGRQVFTFEERLEMLAPYNTKFVLKIDYNEKFKSTPPLDFLSNLEEHINIKGYMSGKDFRFGAGAKGKSSTLKKYADDEDNAVWYMPVKDVVIDGEKVSTTLIKKYLEEGKIQQANKLLGREYFITGKVCRGHGRGGSELGFPTANIAYPEDKVLVAEGVYGVEVVTDGVTYKGVANFGGRPTFGEETPVLEAYLEDFSGDLYGKTVTLRFLNCIRATVAFESEEALSAQIADDLGKIGKPDSSPVAAAPSAAPAPAPASVAKAEPAPVKEEVAAPVAKPEPAPAAPAEEFNAAAEEFASAEEVAEPEEAPIEEEAETAAPEETEEFVPIEIEEEAAPEEVTAEETEEFVPVEEEAEPEEAPVEEAAEFAPIEIEDEPEPEEAPVEEVEEPATSEEAEEFAPIEIEDEPEPEEVTAEETEEFVPVEETEEFAPVEEVEEPATSEEAEEFAPIEIEDEPEPEEVPVEEAEEFVPIDEEPEPAEEDVQDAEASEETAEEIAAGDDIIYSLPPEEEDDDFSKELQQVDDEIAEIEAELYGMGSTVSALHVRPDEEIEANEFDGPADVTVFDDDADGSGDGGGKKDD